MTYYHFINSYTIQAYGYFDVNAYHKSSSYPAMRHQSLTEHRLSLTIVEHHLTACTSTRRAQQTHNAHINMIYRLMTAPEGDRHAGQCAVLSQSRQPQVLQPCSINKPRTHTNIVKP